MSEPMSAERLEEIRERDANTVARMYHTRMTPQERNHLWSDMDRRALLAEVDRLRAQVVRVEALLDANADGRRYNGCYLTIAARLAVREMLDGER